MTQTSGGDGDIEKLLWSTPTASLIVGPRGNTIAGPLVGEEGILYADVDLAEEIALKQAHDIVGTYQRLDLFELKVDTTRPNPVTLLSSDHITHRTTTTVTPEESADV